MSDAAHIRDPKFYPGANGTGSTIDAFLAVKVAASYAISLPTASTQPVYGITAEDILDGERGNVQVRGEARWIAGTGGLAVGDRVTVEANTGKGITWAPAAGANATIRGLCTKAAAANGIAVVDLDNGNIGQGA